MAPKSLRVLESLKEADPQRFSLKCDALVPEGFMHGWTSMQMC